jgi:hypothetical protein
VSSHQAPPPPPAPAATGPNGWVTAVIMPIVLLVVAAGSGAVFAQQENPPQTCTAYYREIGALVDDGLTPATFVEMRDESLEKRCGEADEIADDWANGSPNPSNGTDGSGEVG